MEIKSTIKLSTWVNLDQKGIHKASTRCLICDGKQETQSHIFLSCDEARDLWSFFFMVVGQSNSFYRG